MADTNMLSRELRFAWLLRDDVRRLFPESDPEWRTNLEIWWLLNSHTEYPVAARRVDADKLHNLCEAVIPAAEPGGFPVTRLMRAIWSLRDDVQRRFPPGAVGAVGAVAGFVRWFFVCGVPEHNLFRFIARDWVTRLLDCPPQPGVDGAAGYTLLTAYTWQSLKHLQDRFDIADPTERLRYIGWYFDQGGESLGHGPYWALRQPKWLARPHPGCGGLPLAAAAAWLWRFPNAGLHDIASAEAGREVLAWFQAQPELVARLLPSAAPHTGPQGRADAGAAPCRSGQGATKRTLLPGVNIVGYARGELGIGEDSRMAALALGRAGVPFSVVNVPCGPDTRQADKALDAHLSDEAPYAVNLFCLTGMDTARVWLERGPELFEGRTNIGCWPWELPEWPAPWGEAYDLVHEIWASSRYTRDAFRRSSPAPVRLMPMTVTLDRIRFHPRSAYGLPDGAYLFLYVFDFNSYLARKNPQAALRAFRKAFPAGHEPVRLVLKIMNAKQGDPRWRAFAHEASQDSRVLMISGTMDRPDVLGLFAACDAFVSPHRAEGFGRTLAEAMLLEKPVIATRFSGTADFLSEETGFPVDSRMIPVRPGEYPYGEGMHWAEPDVDELARHMRQVTADPREAARRAAGGRRLMLARHSPDAVGRAYATRLAELLF